MQLVELRELSRPRFPLFARGKFAVPLVQPGKRA